MQHEWVKSTLGHGETMCAKCFITNREAAVLGMTNTCDAPPPKAANANPDPIGHDPLDDEPGMIEAENDRLRRRHGIKGALAIRDAIVARAIAAMPHDEEATEKPRQTGVGAQAELIVDAIIEDLSDRRGLRQEWEAYDEGIQAEIRAEWMLIARRVIERG